MKMSYRIEKQKHSGISYGKEIRYFHISKKMKKDGYFSVFEIAENSDCSLCHKRDTECFSFSVNCANADNDDYDTYWAEDEIFICSECLKNGAERLQEHQEKMKKMDQKVISLKKDIGKIVECTMGDGEKIVGELTKVVEKNRKIYVLKNGNKNAIGIDLMEVEGIKKK
jgi:hypothetical protein